MPFSAYVAYASCQQQRVLHSGLPVPSLVHPQREELAELLAKNLQRFRKQAGFKSTDDLAFVLRTEHGMKINKQTIDRYEQGIRILDAVALKVFADVLRRPLDHFFFEEDPYEKKDKKEDKRVRDPPPHPLRPGR